MTCNNVKAASKCPIKAHPDPPVRSGQTMKKSTQLHRAVPLCRIFDNDRLIYSDDFIREAQCLCF
ncbi:MAG: hypothetical protein ACQEQL_02630 [Pseudomonadota bacterium]